MKVLTATERRWPALLVAVVLTVLGMAGCSGGDDEKKGKDSREKPTEPAPDSAFAFSITGADVQSAAPQAPPFPEDLKAAVKSSLDTYLANGVVTPLKTGQPPAGLEAVFTGAAAARVAPGHPDRVALLEEGQPVSGKVTRDRADLKLTALIDPAGAPAVVTAQVDLAVTVKGKDTTLTVVRTGELMLVFDNNAWRIDAFDMRTARDSK